MNYTLFCIAALFSSLTGNCKRYAIHLSNGATFSKILPQGEVGSNGDIRYSLKEGLYIAPSFVYKNAAYGLFFEYCLQLNKVGITHKTNNAEYAIKYRSNFYDSYVLHNFAIGAYRNIEIINKALILKPYLKVGIGLGKFSGSGSSITHGPLDDPINGSISYESSFSSTGKYGFVMPNASIGLFLTPRFKNKLQDNLSLEMAVLTSNKNIYRDQSVYTYKFENNRYRESGSIHYHGIPLTFLVGLNFRVFSFQ